MVEALVRGPSSDQTAAMRLYAGLLEEAKVRIGCVENILDRRVALPSPILHELSYLQLRLLCELIALGCLVLHGDIKAAGHAKAIREGKLKKAWSAQVIMDELSALHPSFYPLATSKMATKGGFHLTPLRPDEYLTKEDLVRLWNEAGRHLHRGDLKRLLKQQMPTQFNFPDVHRWMKKIGALLSIHTIPLFDPQTVLLVVLRNRDDNENVQVTFGSALSPEDHEPLAQARAET